VPIVRVDGPKIDIEKKRELAKRLTEAVAEVYGMDKRHIIVLINENEPENVSVGGELIADRLKGSR
jgi:4-oxalocrotonate tautomerase